MKKLLIILVLAILLASCAHIKAPVKTTPALSDVHIELRAAAEGFRDDFLTMALVDYDYCARDWVDFSFTDVVQALSHEAGHIQYVDQGEKDRAILASEIAATWTGDCDDFAAYFLCLGLYSPLRSRLGVMTIKHVDGSYHVVPVAYSPAQLLVIWENTSNGYDIYTFSEYLRANPYILALAVAYMFPAYVGSEVVYSWDILLRN